MNSPPPQPNEGEALRARALRGAAWSMANQAGTQLVSILVWIVLGRTILPAEFGLVALAQLIITFLLIFLEQGYAEALVQKPEMTREDENTAFWTVLAAGLLLMAAANLLAGPMARWQAEPQLEPMLRALSAGFPIMALRTVPEAVLIRSMRMRTLAARSLVSTAAAGATGVALALAGFGAWALVAQALVISAAGSGLLWALSGWRPGWGWSGDSFRALCGFGVHITGTNLLAYANRRFDQWLVEHWHGKVVLGFYQMAQRWVEVQSALLGQGLNQVALSAFSRVQDDRARLARGWVQASGLVAAAAAPALAGLAATAPDVLQVLVGPRWLPAAAMMAWISVGAIPQTLSFLSNRALVAGGRPGWCTWASAINFALSAALMLAAAPYGAVWIAAAYGLRAWLIAPLIWAMMHRLLRPDWRAFFRGLAGPLACSAAMAAAVKAFALSTPAADWTPLLRLCVCATLGAGIYAGLLRALAPGSWQALARARDRLRAGPASPQTPPPAPPGFTG